MVSLVLPYRCTVKKDSLLFGHQFITTRMARMLLLALLCIITLPGKAQTINKKGKVAVFWGYSREAYTRSDIHLKGAGYDYTLHDVTAKDSPKNPDWSYFNPALITIPQFDLRVAYYFNEHYGISAGWDHMKYVLNNYQTAKISGYINSEALYDGSWENSPVSAQYVGQYNNDDLVLDNNFIKYEHTDGLNFARISLERLDRLWINHNLGITWSNELGAGPVLPWTDFTHLGGNRYRNRLHLSGWGIGLYSGIRFEFKETIYLTSNVGAGYINLFDVESKKGKADQATQQFWFAKCNIGVGLYLTAFKQNKE